MTSDFFNTVEPFLEMLLSERGVSRLTIEAYGRDLKQFGDFLGARGFLEVNREDIQKYMAFLAASGLKARSIARHLSSLRQFYKFWLDERRLTVDPTLYLHTPKIPQSLPKFLSPQEMTRLIDIARQDLTPEGRRLWAFVELFYATGMRVSELLSLTLQQLLTPQGALRPERLVYIKGKGGKERMVMLTLSACSALKSYLDIRSSFLKGLLQPNPYLFPSRGKTPHLTRQRVLQLLKELADKAGLDPEKISPHVLRHAFATHLLQGGADLISLQRLLGHSDLSSTQIYTHVVQDHLTEAVLNHHPLSERKRRSL